jgi:hypothetical protein
MTDVVLIGTHSTLLSTRKRPAVKQTLNYLVAQKNRLAVNTTFNPENTTSSNNNQPTDTQYWTDS